MNISDLISELQEVQDKCGDIPVNISMNGYKNGDTYVVMEKNDEFTFYVQTIHDDQVALLLEGDSRDLDSSIGGEFG